MNKLKKEKPYYYKFTKTEYLNTTISDLLMLEVSEQILSIKMTLEMCVSFLYPLGLEHILRKTKKLYDEYRIVSEEETVLGDIDFRFTICFLKFHNFTFKQIEKLITEEHKRFNEEIEKDINNNIDLALTKIYLVLNKLTKKNFKKWNLKSAESGLDQLFFKWRFLGGRELELTFKMDKLSGMKRFLLEIYKKNKRK